MFNNNRVISTATFQDFTLLLLTVLLNHVINYVLLHSDALFWSNCISVFRFDSCPQLGYNTQFGNIIRYVLYIHDLLLEDFIVCHKYLFTSNLKLSQNTTIVKFTVL